jgi:hypothetical protein
MPTLIELKKELSNEMEADFLDWNRVRELERQIKELEDE